MIIPKKLKKGDLIAIVSPAGSINPDYIDKAKIALENKAYRVRIYPNAKNKYHQYAGTDAERLSDLQGAINDKDVACILCARGGYGLARIIDDIDFAKLLKYPKWIVGFSDITILHSALQNQSVMSIHASMAKIFIDSSTESEQSFFKALETGSLEYSIERNSLNRLGNTNAQLTGGNLSVLTSLLGTPYMPEVKGRILFIEDLNEYLYRLDRMMISLKLAGVLSQISGLVVGGFTDMLDNDSPFGKSAYEIISEHVSNYSFPVVFGFPAGHIADNRAVVLGAETFLEVSNEYVSVKQQVTQ